MGWFINVRPCGRPLSASLCAHRIHSAVARPPTVGLPVRTAAIPQRSHVWDASIASSRRRPGAEASERPRGARPLIGRRCHRSGGGRKWPYLWSRHLVRRQLCRVTTSRLPHGTFTARHVASQVVTADRPTTSCRAMGGRQISGGWKIYSQHSREGMRQRPLTVVGGWYGGPRRRCTL